MPGAVFQATAWKTPNSSETRTASSPLPCSVEKWGPDLFLKAPHRIVFVHQWRYNALYYDMHSWSSFKPTSCRLGQTFCVLNICINSIIYVDPARAALEVHTAPTGRETTWKPRRFGKRGSIWIHSQGAFGRSSQSSRLILGCFSLERINILNRVGLCRGDKGLPIESSGVRPQNQVGIRFHGCQPNENKVGVRNTKSKSALESPYGRLGTGTVPKGWCLVCLVLFGLVTRPLAALAPDLQGP